MEIQEKAQKINQKIEDQIEKNNIWQIGIEEWNWKQIKLIQKSQEQNSKNKNIKTKVEILTTKRAEL